MRLWGLAGLKSVRQAGRLDTQAPILGQNLLPQENLSFAPYAFQLIE